MSLAVGECVDRSAAPPRGPSSSSSGPSTSVEPETSRVPPSATSSTSRVSPGSKRTAVPAAIFEPHAVGGRRDRTPASGSPRRMAVRADLHRPIAAIASTSMRARRTAGVQSRSDRSLEKVFAGNHASIALTGSDEWTVTSLVPSGKRAFDLNLRNHLRHAVHHRVGRKNRRAEAHDLGDRSCRRESARGSPR